MTLKKYLEEYEYGVFKFGDAYYSGKHLAAILSTNSCHTYYEKHLNEEIIVFGEEICTFYKDGAGVLTAKDRARVKVYSKWSPGDSE